MRPFCLKSGSIRMLPEKLSNQNNATYTDEQSSGIKVQETRLKAILKTWIVSRSVQWYLLWLASQGKQGTSGRCTPLSYFSLHHPTLTDDMWHHQQSHDIHGTVSRNRWLFCNFSWCDHHTIISQTSVIFLDMATLIGNNGMIRQGILW